MITSAAAGSFAGLPRERYITQAWFDREMGAIHHRNWLYGCHLSELAAPGDFVIRRVAPYDELILVHAANGAINAFFNVCRHRGSKICIQPSGHVTRFRCPYHSWTYDLDGRLLGSQGKAFPEPPPREGVSLIPAVTEVWRGHIFFALGPDRPLAISPQLDASAPDIGLFTPERTKVAAKKHYQIHANWKLVMQNFWECYHCPSGHPEFCFAADVDALYNSDFGEVSAANAAVPPVVEGPLPLKAGMDSLTMDGRPVCRRPLGSFGLPDVSAVTSPRTAGIILRYSTALTYFADYGICLDFQPISIDQTRLVTRWFVDEDAQEGLDYRVPELMQLWDITNEQDGVFAELNHAGVMSTRYVPGPHSLRLEPGILGFLQFCEQEIGRSNGGPAAR